MKLNFQYWIKFSIFNLLLVALLGLLMRYKITFELPLINQKNLQHSHSHFAFAGWVSQTLYVLIVRYLSNSNTSLSTLKYKSIFIANLICSYVMLFSFIFQGYGLISIVFSTLSLFISFWFAVVYIKDLKQTNNNTLSNSWFKGALFFNIISSFGTFALAFMMATKNVPQDLYLSSIYYYLHFQYNGWFWFACIGLFVSQIKSSAILEKKNKQIYSLFFISCIPAFLLSVLWLKLPFWLYGLGVLSAIVQIVAWVQFCREIIPEYWKKTSLTPFFKWILYAIACCASLKLLLQLASTVPEISQYVFGFRPIVIAYLHLVLLAIISLFLLNFIYTTSLLTLSKNSTIALCIFILGIIANEIILAIQGIASFSYTLIPYLNEMLLGAAIVLFSGMFILFYSTTQKK